MKPLGGWGNFLWWLRPSKLRHMFKDIYTILEAGEVESEAMLGAALSAKEAYDRLAERVYHLEGKVHVMCDEEVVCDWPHNKDEEVKH